MKLKTLGTVAILGLALAAGAHGQDASSTGPADTIVISRDGSPFTVINRLTPSAADRDELLSALRTGISEEMSVLDGFIAAAIHESADSEDVIVYAQWESGEALGQAAARVQAGDAPNMGRAYQLGNPEYHPFNVVAVIQAAAE